MKKAKILALILVMSLMVTGTAYALWNQNIEVSTTAAMGDMDVTVQGQFVVPLSTMPARNLFGVDNYMTNLTCGPVAGSSGHSLLVTAGDLYPGAKFGIDFWIKNTGKVPVTLKGVTVDYAGGDYGLFTQLLGNCTLSYIPFSGFGSYPITLAREYYSLSTADLGSAIAAACSDIILYPGDEIWGRQISPDSANTFMQVTVPDTITGSDYENLSTSFKIGFNWEQCNPTRS